MPIRCFGSLVNPVSVFLSSEEAEEEGEAGERIFLLLENFVQFSLCVSFFLPPTFGD